MTARRCRCGEEILYGPLATAEEVARGRCSACEAGRAPEPPEALLAACREMAAHRAAGRYGERGGESKERTIHAISEAARGPQLRYVCWPASAREGRSGTMSGKDQNQDTLRHLESDARAALLAAAKRLAESSDLNRLSVAGVDMVARGAAAMFTAAMLRPGDPPPDPGAQRAGDPPPDHG